MIAYGKDNHPKPGSITTGKGNSCSSRTSKTKSSGFGEKSSSPEGCGIFLRQTLRVWTRDSQAGEK